MSVPEKVIDHLKVRGMYLFSHKRKGPFHAKFMGFVEQVEDEADPRMLRVEISTGAGTGQERLANAMLYTVNGKVPQPVTEKLLRPSQLESIQSVNQGEQDRLLAAFTASQAPPKREVYAPVVSTPSEPETPVGEEPKKKGLLSRIFGGDN